MRLRRRPTERQAIWLLTALVLAGRPVTSVLYWNAVLHAGVLRPDADSIGLLIFADLVVALLAAIPMLVVTGLALICQAGAFRLWSWDRRRPVLSTVWSLGLGCPALGLTYFVARDYGQAWPWYEYLWLPHLCLMLAWLLVMRGVALSNLAR